MAFGEAKRARLARVMDNLGQMGLDQMLLCDPVSICWLTDFYVNPGERFYGMVLRRGADPVMVVNDLFPTPADLGVQTVGFRDTDDPVSVVEKLLDKGARLGCDKDLAAKFLLPLAQRGAAAGFVLGSPAVDGARALKAPDEIELMRRASKTNDDVMGWLRAQVREGVTENQIAAGLLEQYKARGAQGFSFPPIVSFGANAADPHHHPDDTALVPGQVVLFDVGCVQDGYCSDMTRTFWFKSVTDEERNVYELVRAANAAAFAAVRPGALFSDIDLAGRNIIEAGGYGKEFTHRLGHSIGMTDHEPGDVSCTHREPVRPGMCFSDEPGIYLEGRFGVRIEDLICVTEDGGELLNAYPRTLEVLD